MIYHITNALGEEEEPHCNAYAREIDLFKHAMILGDGHLAGKSVVMQSGHFVNFSVWEPCEKGVKSGMGAMAKSCERCHGSHGRKRPRQRSALEKCHGIHGKHGHDPLNKYFPGRTVPLGWAQNPARGHRNIIIL